uniref:(northern house mosquito) hypothetical protein n=1 Tax=Culex pipiens TaxID=7175 RepID=A0A8D8HZK9_CULPI
MGISAAIGYFAQRTKFVEFWFFSPLKKNLNPPVDPAPEPCSSTTPISSTNTPAAIPQKKLLPPTQLLSVHPGRHEDVLHLRNGTRTGPQAYRGGTGPPKATQRVAECPRENALQICCFSDTLQWTV